MKTFTMSKRNMQSVLRELRTVPHCKVEKLDGGYQVTATIDGLDPDNRCVKAGDVLLKAMQGTHAYLVRAADHFILENGS